MSTLPTSVLQPVYASSWTSVPTRDTAAWCSRLFVVWLVVRTVIWTVLAYLQPNPPLDTIEWLTWGREWQLGYHKHPPLAAWVAEVAFRWSGGSFLGIYLTSYLAIGLALWCVWNLARQYVHPRTALALTMTLDGLQALGPGAAEFNNQVLLIACWAVAIERFHEAVRQDRLRDWVLTGLALGLGLLCKYTVVFLAVSLLGWWLWKERTRRWSRPLLVGAVAAVVFLPHFVWLVGTGFPTLKYASDRAQVQPSRFPAAFSGVMFLLGQLLRLLPVLLILWPILRLRRRPLDEEGQLARSLVYTAVLGPLGLYLLASLGGVQLRDIWGAPLLVFSSLALVLVFKTDESGRSWWRLRLAWLVVAGGMQVLMLMNNVQGSAYRSRGLRIHYPGELLGREVISRYQQRYGQYPAIVGGDWWLAGNVACHGTERPTVYGSREPAYAGLDFKKDKGDPRRYMNPEQATCPWTGDGDLRERGGVLLWDASVYGEDLPPWLQERFPGAAGQRVLSLRFLGGSQMRLKVGWAMIPPAKQEQAGRGREVYQARSGSISSGR